MKTYIFIIRRICNVTGAQIYVYNKTKYLEERGWKVLIFSSLEGEILIDNFRRFESNIYPALYFNPAYYRKTEVEGTLKRILEKIGDVRGNECIIESDSLPRALWAEMIASRLGCRHLAFFVQEKQNLHFDQNIRDFLRFKYDRHELAGITENSISIMFGSEIVEQREDVKFGAFCNNVIEDCEDKYSNWLDPKADLTLGSFGRLDKPCVPAIVDGFYTYAKLHPDQFFNIVMIGGASVKGKVAVIKKKMSELHNVNLVITGNLYPVPLSLMNKVDVFVSTAGSAIASYCVSRPTVTVNPTSGSPVGIIGLDFFLKEKNMYDSETDTHISTYIDRAIKSRDKIEYRSTLGERYYDKMYAEFDRQLSYVKKVDKNEYYDEGIMKRMKKPGKYHLFKSFFIPLLGSKGQACVWRILRNR